jgi:3-methylcrotonyl-CoA carboxylase alpha subunit
VAPIVTRIGNGLFRVGEAPARIAWAVADGTARWVFLDGDVYVIEAARGGARTRRRGHGDSLAAPMPATVRKIHVKAGDSVAAGDVLLVLDAMKMELPVRAPRAGRIRALQCTEGELVQPGIPLVALEDH